MAQTYLQDFKRDDGSPITVEYSADGGEPNADLPGHICDGGGSGPEISIVKAFTDDSDDVKLTDAEDQRFCDWLAEHHEFDDGSDFEDYR